MLRTLAPRWNKEKFRYEAKIEESEKAGSRRESNPGFDFRRLPARAKE